MHPGPGVVVGQAVLAPGPRAAAADPAAGDARLPPAAQPGAVNHMVITHMLTTIQYEECHFSNYQR